MTSCKTSLSLRSGGPEGLVSSRLIVQYLNLTLGLELPESHVTLPKEFRQPLYDLLKDRGLG